MTDSGQPMTHPDLTGYLLGVASRREMEEVRHHLDRCRRCTREVEELEELPRLLATAAPPARPTAGLEGRVLRAVRREQAPAERRWPWPLGAERWRRPTARWAPVWAAAAALILAVAGGLAVSSVFRPHPPGGAGAAQRPGVQTIQLVAADGGGARGAARIENGPSGKVVALTVEGLSANPPGEVYVCWLVDQGDTLEQQNRVAVGAFSVSGPEPVTMRWTTGADTAHYRLQVTREQAGGYLVHRGPAVLTAQ